MKSFAKISQSEYEDQAHAEIQREIKACSKDYVLNVDEEEYCNYLFSKYSLEPLEIDISSELLSGPKKITRRSRDFRDDEYELTYYEFLVCYSFRGTSRLFQVQPSSWILSTYDIDVDSSRMVVSLSFEIDRQDPELFRRVKAESIKKAFANVDNVNSFVRTWNERLRDDIYDFFKKLKSDYVKENEFFRAIDLKLVSGSDITYSIPTVKKISIDPPKAPKGEKLSFSPVLSDTMYDHIIKAILIAGKAMERKPSLYRDKDEESLRDLFIFQLESRFDSVTATGETFNKNGKTDIVLKYAPDSTNLFVAECKFWRGKKAFLSSISQLFDRYLTWRDSKVALMIFVDKDNMTSVVGVVTQSVKEHDYYVAERRNTDLTSFGYFFRLPQDVNKTVYLEVILFHFP